MKKSLDILWAPWRVSYITQNKKNKGCFLCKALKSKDDKKNFVLYRGKNAFVIFNIYPYNNGHLMIVPNRYGHYREDKGRREQGAVLSFTGIHQIIKVIKPAGFNIGINLAYAASCRHLHIHSSQMKGTPTLCL